jgi:hypothetical protein
LCVDAVGVKKKRDSTTGYTANRSGLFGARSFRDEKTVSYLFSENGDRHEWSDSGLRGMV